MLNFISERVIIVANYIADTGATVRNAAKKFGMGKSTVHKDMTERLLNIDNELYLKVKKVLEINKEERHIRGGIATKNKYKKRT